MQLRAKVLGLVRRSGCGEAGLWPGPCLLGARHGWHVSWGSWTWNSYSLLYATLAFTIMVGLAALQTLDEPKKMTWDVFMSELLVKTPSRAVSRIIGRLRGPTTLG